MDRAEQRTRRPDVDWLRVLLFAGLIAYHLGLLYSSWSVYGLKSEHRAPWVEILLLLTHPWRMCLLFLISGIATRYAADKLSVPRLFVSRTAQLLPPLLFAIAVLVPVQGYLQMADNLGYQAPYLAYLTELFSTGHHVVFQGRRFQLPVYAHLWFVLYLWTYIVLLAAALWTAPRWVGLAERGLARLVKGKGLLIWPLLVTVALRALLFPAIPTTLGYIDDWYTHVLSLGMFAFGFLIARSEAVWNRAEALRWPALILALVGWAAYAVMLWGGKAQPETVELANPVMHIFYPLEAWGAIVAVLGFARRHLRRESRAVRYLNGGMFTYYIVHQPAMLGLLYGLKPLGLGPAAELSLVLGGTIAACALAYELARNLGGFAVLLGARPVKRRASSALARPAWGQPALDAVH